MQNRPNNSSHPIAKRIGYLKRILKREKMIKGKFPWYSFNTSLKELNEIMKINVLNEIRNHMKLSRTSTAHVLDLGAGSGRTASEISQAIPNIKITATGLKKRAEWNAQPNTHNINWVPVEFERLSSKVKPNSVDFIYSNFGIGHAQNLTKAFLEVHKVLKKGGRIIYSYDAPFPGGGAFIPNGFKAVKQKAIIHQEEPDMDSTRLRTVIYIEKI